jgi:hypothetical protein
MALRILHIAGEHHHPSQMMMMRVVFPCCSHYCQEMTQPTLVLTFLNSFSSTTHSSSHADLAQVDLASSIDDHLNALAQPTSPTDEFSEPIPEQPKIVLTNVKEAHL